MRFRTNNEFALLDAAWFIMSRFVTTRMPLSRITYNCLGKGIEGNRSMWRHEHIFSQPEREATLLRIPRSPVCTSQVWQQAHVTTSVQYQ